MDEILYKIDKIRYYKISKCNDLEFTAPKYEIKYSRTFQGIIPDWININKNLVTNSFIIDKNIEKKRNILNDPNIKEVHKYMTYDLIRGINYLKFNQKLNEKSRLKIGSWEIPHKEEITNSILVIDVNYNNLNLIHSDNFDSVIVYNIDPLGIKLKDDRIEQKRLKINIDKLKVLKYLKDGGSFGYVITHLTIDATQEIIIILSYLFEECLLFRQTLYEITTTGLWIYCKKFNKKRFYEIEDKISINRFEEFTGGFSKSLNPILDHGGKNI